MKPIFKTISEGEYKGKRFYDESVYGSNDILPFEMKALFEHSLKNNYKIFVLNCVPNHNIIIPQNDLDFLGKSLSWLNDEEEEIYINYKFSNEVLQIKEFQYFDIKKLYNIAILNNNIGALFTYPHLSKNYYCFDVTLIVTEKFNLNDVLNLNFSLIKINSINEYNKNNLDLNFLKNLYDLNKLIFKDYITTLEENNQSRLYDVLKLPEKIEYNNYCDFYLNFKNNNPNINTDNMEKKLADLKKKLYEKENELWDVEVSKKLYFSKICMQFYFFHEIILEDSIFFTNFLQIMGGVKLDSYENGSLKIDYSELNPYSLSDMFGNDSYMLFSMFFPIFHWGKK